MDDNNLISVGLRHPELDKFARFMAVTTELLRKDASDNVQLYSKQNGEKLEHIVLDRMRKVAPDFNIDAEEIRHTPKQHFPDILMGTNYGVEVKSTKEKSWQSVGSSIVESLREDQVKKVFLMFGRLSAPDIDFRCKPYEECLYDIAVTHSPRYLINMDLKNESQTIFNKMNMPYDSFRECDNQIDVVRDYYRKKFKKSGRKGEMPWWIGDQQGVINHFEPTNLRDTSNIRMMKNLDIETSDYLKVCAYVLFPEIVGKDQTKYQNYSLWLCSRYSIICSSLRDQFSAGGQGNIYVNNKLKWMNVPKVVCNLLMYIDKILFIFEHHTDVYNEISYYSDYYQEGYSSMIHLWVQAINFHLRKVTDNKITAENLLALKFDKNIGNDFYTIE